MSNDGKQIGFGTIVKLSSISSATSSTAATATAIGNLIDFGGFTNAIPPVDTTDIADAAATFAPATPAAGPGAFTCGYKQGDTGQKKLVKFNKNRTIGSLWVVFASTALADESYVGYVSDVGQPTAAKDGRVNRTFAFQPTGAIAFSTV